MGLKNFCVDGRGVKLKFAAKLLKSEDNNIEQGTAEKSEEDNERRQRRKDLSFKVDC